jgi:tetratricopeptide (TPR) repeat protein
VPGKDQVDRELPALACEWHWYPVLRCAIANWLWSVGRADEAGDDLDRLAAGGFAAIPRDEEWFLATTLLAEPCATLRPEHAGTLRESLAPFADQNAHGAIEIALGSAHRYVGLLATAEGRREEAETHLETAFEANERMGARPWAAHVREDQARLLLQGGERERGETVLAEALERYRELGMRAAEERALRLAQTV